MIYHAYETVPFYQGLINNIVFDIKKLPIIEKKQMIESGRSLLSSKYMGKYLSNQLKWTRTSGSSGLLYEIYWDKVDDKKSMLELWLLRWKYYKVSPKQKMCYFFPADIGSFVVGISRCVAAPSLVGFNFQASVVVLCAADVVVQQCPVLGQNL